MMTTQPSIKPSRDARRLFCKMVQKAEDDTLTLDETVVLSIEQHRRGNYGLTTQVAELMSEGWIAADPCGGWNVRPRTFSRRY